MPENQEQPSEKEKKREAKSLRTRIRRRKEQDEANRRLNDVSQIFKCNKKSLLLLWEELSIGNVPVDLPMRLADVGKEMTAEEKMNAVDGSSVLVQSQITSLIIQLKSFINTREDAIELTPIICKAVDSLTKMNVASINARVDIAEANRGIKALTGKMFVPPSVSFAPGEQIVLEPDIQEQDAQVIPQ